MCLLAIGGQLVNLVIAGQRSHRFGPTLWWLFVAEAFVTLLMAGSTRMASHFDLLLSNQFSLRMNLRLIAHCDTLDLETLENSVFQDRLQRAREQIATQIALIKTLLQLLQQCIGVGSVIVGSVIAVPSLIAVQLLGVLPLIVLEAYHVRRRYLVMWGRTQAKRQLDYLQSLITSTASAKETKLFSAGAYVYNRYQAVASEHNSEDAGLSRSAAGMATWLSSCATVVYYCAYGFLIRSAILGVMSIGALVFLAGLLQRFNSQLLSLLNSFLSGLDQMLYVGDLVDFFSYPSRKRSLSITRLVPERISKGIEFKNVSFKYDGVQTAALSNVSFCIRPGEVIALVGENGAGKTTIAKLIARLYEPTEGAILLDGCDIREYDLTCTRALTTAVFQDFAKYDLSALLNIALGDTSSLNDFSRISHATRVAGAHTIISALPNRYDQILGRRFGGGVDLSGGQWQRLALARAYVRNATIVILDEPTAALDARTEAALYQELITVCRGKMVILISHRLSTVRFANRILVLKDGSICEEGTHTDLIRLRGEYAELFALQARGYVS